MFSSYDGNTNLPGHRHALVPTIHSEAKIFETMVEEWERQSTRAKLVERIVRRRTQTPRLVYLVIQEYPWNWSTASIIEYCSLARLAGLSSRYVTTQLRDLRLFYLFINATYSHVFADTRPLPARLDFAEVVAHFRTENV